jgi:hypothetical protein
MPKGQSPRARMLQREAALSADLKRDRSGVLNRIRSSLLSIRPESRSTGTVESQRVVTQKRNEDEKRLEKIRKSLGRNAMKLTGGPL